MTISQPLVSVIIPNVIELIKTQKKKFFMGTYYEKKYAIFCDLCLKAHNNTAGSCPRKN